MKPESRKSLLMTSAGIFSFAGEIRRIGSIPPDKRK